MRTPEQLRELAIAALQKCEIANGSLLEAERLIAELNADVGIRAAVTTTIARSQHEAMKACEQLSILVSRVRA